MRACCLVNHYEYGQYVGEAVRSAVEQSRALDEIVVVDDGSGPEALEAVRGACSAHEGVRLVEKRNGGQLSCFESGLEHSSAEIVFFLDADDAWEPEYVKTVLAVFEERPDVGFVACNERRVFSDGRSEVSESPTRDLGYSLIRSLEPGAPFIGQPTSCLAIRRSVLDKIFPLELAEGWRTCADEALVYGSSLVGARKLFLGDPLVRYRVHGSNHFYGRPYRPEDRLLRGVEVLRLTEVLRRRQGLPSSLAHLAHHEFRTIENPTRGEYRGYRRLVADAPLPARRKRRIRSALFAWYRFRKRV
ncbi:MAG: glycosyltransferase family 2 protein [Planctomycetota bacterium]